MFIILKNLRLSGHCFDSFSENNNIQELLIENCEFDSKIKIYNFTLNLKNLIKLEIICTRDDKIIKALNSSRIENLTDVNITALCGRPDADLLEFLLRQKKLSKLCIKHVLFDSDFINKLPNQNLKLN